MSLFEKRLRAYLLIPEPIANSRLQEYLRSLLQNERIQIITIDGSPFSTVQSAQSAIKEADFIIADISSKNPNTMYDIGYAHGIKKPILFIARQDTREVPIDIKGSFYFVYNLNDLPRLGHNIKMWISSLNLLKRKME